MRFFFDNNLSPKYARAIDALEGDNGNTVRHLKQEFDKSTPDDVWIRSLGDSGGWAVVTSDYSITKNPHEVEAWRESRLTVFFLRSAWFKVQFWEQAGILVRRWRQIVTVAERHPESYLCVIPVKGSKFQEIN